MENVINLGIGEPDFDTPSHIKDAAKTALEEGYTHYTPNNGFIDLREAISERVRRENGLDYNPDEIIVTNGGGTGSIFLAMMALVNPGEEVI
ncbi:aminotransferase class I/II-fold pyridoxal phosphate-dependent enzyme, partial [Candidatus Bathyarchaeota archaeon]|nr:aminotransferase class I/II-fold pyridoxal phosphate-dependent enzyme [Candidatus Bathyarchaeota archaeon]